ncbi:MAG: hypothetical protein M0R17_05155 [Candidatus Omnitrophica bacterium]|nr:hypothetical protein [Candidatus Omnitrophota bacterium]
MNKPIPIQTKLVLNKIQLIDETDCPAFFTFKGKCFKCKFLLEDNKCTITKCFKPIEQLSNSSLCPIKHNNCHNCLAFLSFTSNGFYCNEKA